MNVLVINAGSSSLKYQLFDMDTETVVAKGVCERIGIDGRLTHKPVSNGKPEFKAELPLPTHAEAINAVIEKLTSPEYGVISSLKEIGAVGHRVLHGGQKFSESVLINDTVIAAITECIPLGPLHNPANLMGIKACQKVMPGVPQVAVFDTAFHQTMPKHAYIYPIPYSYYEKYGLRRYGFHGTSHRYVSKIALEMLGIPAAGSRLITCHLGNGSSLAAVKDGKCVDTTMGLSPLEGLPMGTRSGSIDPTILSVMAANEGLTINQILDVLNKESGVLGVSGVSSDFRDIEQAAHEGNARAELALDIFDYDVKKYIGAYMAAMGGADAIVFTAGLGENGPETRERIVAGLEPLGICIDKEQNNVRGQQRDITGKGSKVKVFVIPTNEELVIARDTKEIVGK
ncbi:acetate kinase [Sporobacter termitidis DSM 10068]|uniref:Acetate kinase n=1 Tax=Sporobacter termitidis DSM 10068 TaxID=1123282 RepID=A0A1M5YAB6_9FIRM|nr:acetate kinase [Sporobacter termitidis]SHI08453.1 acetate kinase [Sporobacter termitidis DSM 10068]